MRRALVVVAAVYLCAAAQEKPRGASAGGTVTDAQSGEPVAKVLVILTRQTTQVGARSDANGKFVFAELEPGTYAVDARRTGYIVARGSQKQATVAAGVEATDVAIKIARTGVVTGRVLDPDGEPVSSAAVQLVAVGRKSGAGTGQFANTDDRGQFRVYFVAPGEYKAAVVYSPEAPFSHIKMQNPGDAGQAYPVVYYPSTTDESRAAVIRVDPGAEVAGIDVQLTRARGVTVRGRVLSAGSGVAGSLVTMAPIGRGGRAGPNRTYDRIVDAKGEFEFADVLPGRYRVIAQSFSISNVRQNLSAKRIIEVGAADVEGIDLAPSPPVKVAGRIIVPEGRKLPSGLMAILASRDSGDTNAGGFGNVRPDGSFSIDDVAVGDYDVAVVSMQPDATDEGDDLYVSAIRAGDDDALADGLHVGAGAAAPVEIVVKPNGGVVEVSVADEKDAPAAGATVELVPDPPRHHQLALTGNCKTGADGKCKISGITPGSYHCYAFNEGVQVDARDLDGMKAYEKYGKSVRVDEGEKKSLALTGVPLD